ncbi:hypothetical protein Q1695_012965 [Nippostrongylus brasiliensis]|nr:hypothetical protein Q1695_012965 [Nippostrongylus brasiliensis]
MAKDEKEKKEKKEKKETEKKAKDDKKRDSSKGREDSARLKIIPAELYFLEWTSTALEVYTKLIREGYSVPLIEHCVKTKIADSSVRQGGKSAESEKTASLQKPKRAEQDQLADRLRDAASKVTEWSNPGVEHTRNVRNREVTLAEMAAMFRLRTLVSMSESLVEPIKRVKVWTKENCKMIVRSRTGEVLRTAINMFEATCTIGEVFSLKSVDRSQARKEFQHYLRPAAKDDYQSQDNTTIMIGNPKVYIPTLECRINHYRTCVHQICDALITLIQTYMNSIALEHIDLRTRFNRIH